MSALFSQLAGQSGRRITVYYWAPRLNRPAGHISVLLPNGTYISHYPDKNSSSYKVGTRKKIPTLDFKVDMPIYRYGSERGRTFKMDQECYGLFNSLELPENFLINEIEKAGRDFLLCSAPGEIQYAGPMPYYQLADSEEGKGDRSQCATTTAMVLSRGLSESPGMIAELLSFFDPTKLWEYLLKAANNRSAE